MSGAVGYSDDKSHLPAERLEDVLWRLMLPADAPVQMWHLGNDGVQAVDDNAGAAATNAARAAYLDAVLPAAPIARLSALRALWGWWRALPGQGLAKRQIHRLLEAGGEVYEAVPLTGPHRSTQSIKGALALLLRGGRVSVSAFSGGHRLTDDMVAHAHTLWDELVGATIFLGSGRVFRFAARKEMLRIPVGKQAVARLTRGFAALGHAATLQLAFAVPRAIERFALGGFEVFVESRAPFAGFDYLNMARDERDAVRAEAITAIAQLHESSCRVQRCETEDIDTLFGTPAQRLMDAAPMAHLRKPLDEFLKAIHAAFVGRDIARVLAHGDCKIANFLHDGAFHVRGLVDWDRAAIDGLPGVDVVHYLAFDDMLAGQGTIAETLFARAKALETSAEWAGYRKRFLIEDFRWRAVAAMSLILHVAEQLEAGNEQANAEMRDMPNVVARALDWALGATSPAA